ncbi:hypothetical protein B0H13DRAFT_2378213 [Mycena leptocephala]|nr:hypothetical protein B0H13DRAFT_2378213 [Mycena leptocephala]
MSRGGEKLKAAKGTDANANTDYRIQVPNAPSFMACLLCAARAVLTLTHRTRAHFCLQLVTMANLGTSYDL